MDFANLTNERIAAFLNDPAKQGAFIDAAVAQGVTPQHLLPAVNLQIPQGLSPQEVNNAVSAVPVGQQSGGGNPLEGLDLGALLQAGAKTTAQPAPPPLSPIVPIVPQGGQQLNIQQFKSLPTGGVVPTNSLGVLLGG